MFAAITELSGQALNVINGLFTGIFEFTGNLSSLINL